MYSMITKQNPVLLLITEFQFLINIFTTSPDAEIGSGVEYETFYGICTSYVVETSIQ
jgi:hypothetical protein